MIPKLSYLQGSTLQRMQRFKHERVKNKASYNRQMDVEEKAISGFDTRSILS